MSNEQLQSLLTKVQSDAALRQQLETATSESIKTVAEIAKDAGIVIDANETTAHLSGDDLETMAGGCNDWTCRVSRLQPSHSLPHLLTQVSQAQNKLFNSRKAHVNAWALHLYEQAQLTYPHRSGKRRF